jgi:hypothetical protein
MTSTPETTDRPSHCTAFHGAHRIASGDLEHVARKTKELIDEGQSSLILIFDDTTSAPIDIDFRGTMEDVLRRLGRRLGAGKGDRQPGQADELPAAQRDPPRGPGRPKLGVVAREVTLLPRHWQWLNSQPGGASVALRRLVEHARKANVDKDRVRQAQEAAYRFMSAMAGDRPGFEEAARALFAGNRDRFDDEIAGWPDDIREHTSKVAAAAF